MPLVAGALRGQVTRGFGVSRDSLLFQVVAVPVLVGEGAPVAGALVATTVVGDDVVRDVKATTGSDVVFYATGADDATHLAAASLPRDAALGAARAVATGSGADRLVIGRTPFRAHGATATTAGGDAVGGWAVLRARDLEGASLAGLRAPLLIAGLVGLALALGAAWVAAHRVTRPLRALVAAARRAADLPESDPSFGTAGDEIAALGAAFRGVLADLRDREALTALAPPSAATSAATPAASAAPSVDQPPARPTPRGMLRLHPRPLAAPAPAPARIAGRYELQAVVGAGGAGIVYRALDHTLGEVVALKTLRPELLAADPLARERLTHEIRLARRVSHRHVVRIHDVAEHDGAPFLTMEYVDGPSLAAMLRARGPLPPPATLAVAKQLARALDAAHAQGVVHGDLKPANLLVAPGGLLKVTDFGVARLVRARVAPDSARIAGAVVGTPEYMAPELLLGRAPDVRADLYAAGVVLHECLTGETPFHADTPVAFFAHKLDDPAPAPAAPPPRRPSAPRDPLDAELIALVARLTAADPAQRPPSARALFAALDRLG